jgi:hypothetical protein
MEPLTDTALDNIERELASVPPALSAYCPDDESSLRFHLHVLAPRMLTEIRRHRAAVAADRERVIAVVREAVRDRVACVAGWDGFSPGSIQRMTEDIATRVAERLATATAAVPVPLLRAILASDAPAGELRANLQRLADEYGGGR